MKVLGVLIRDTTIRGRDHFLLRGFRARIFIRDKEKHYKMINDQIFQEDITILNVYTLNNRATKYVRQPITPHTTCPRTGQEGGDSPWELLLEVMDASPWLTHFPCFLPSQDSIRTYLRESWEQEGWGMKQCGLLILVLGQQESPSGKPF